MYFLRTEKGSMKFGVSEVQAGDLLDNVKGEWREKNFVDKGKKSVYVFLDNIQFDYKGLTLYIYSGDYLIKA